MSSINGDSVSSSSGVGSIGVGQVLSRGTILSNNESPSGTNREDYFENCSTGTEPVAENLRALESIFIDSLSTVYPNVQRNLEQMLQMNQQKKINKMIIVCSFIFSFCIFTFFLNLAFLMLTRQTSAPPLGQRSPSNSKS